MNEKTKYYYNDLPEGYKKDYVIDSKDSKFTIIFATIINLVLLASTVAICLAFKGFKIELKENRSYVLLCTAIFLFTMVIYMVLHELTHGLFYKIFTHEKLKFGMTLTVAYCGIPTIYTKKWPMVVTTLAPFVVFTVVFSIPLIFITNTMVYLYASLMLGFHVGGCVGDLYGAIIAVFKYRGKKLLVNDTGPKQTFYIIKDDEE